MLLDNQSNNYSKESKNIINKFISSLEFKLTLDQNKNIEAYSEKKELASTQIESINQPIKPELLYLEQSLFSKQLNLINLLFL